MGWTYFKRYRMEIDLVSSFVEEKPLPAGYGLMPWHPSLVRAHGAVKYACFCYEMDAIVFPCLGDREGCYELMREISNRQGFVPGATWLLEYRAEPWQQPEFCGTVQGVRDGVGYGGIQNLGITPGHRGRGLGSSLLHAALRGFRQAGLQRAYLEVTANNSGAVRLYQRFGFRRVKTVYKAADVAYA